MVLIELFNNLNPTINSLSTFVSTFELTEIIPKKLIVDAAFVLLDILAWVFVLLKFYKIICYTKMTFDWLPMINPYLWPFTIFQILTGFYFAFWARIFPNLKLEKSSIEISGIIALEALNAFVFLTVRLQAYIIVLLENERVGAGWE